MQALLAWSAEVETARREGRPIVCLESSVWCQGLPSPVGLQAAHKTATIIREAGAVPAVLAVQAGRLHIGLSDTALETMCAQPDVIKVSLRELPTAVTLKQWGATTVSASLAMARAAGLDVLATGGLGGVHRNSTWDVSTDLPALGAHRVMVMCSGVKSLLDVAATLERLETEGVPVVGYRTAHFPTFYTRGDRYPVTATVDSDAEAARMLQTMRQLGWERGIVVAQPVPAAAALRDEELEGLLDQAHHAASRHGVAGKHLTPFILGFLHEHTQGRSLQANLALLEENARLAARVAVLAT